MHRRQHRPVHRPAGEPGPQDNVVLPPVPVRVTPDLRVGPVPHIRRVLTAGVLTAAGDAGVAPAARRTARNRTRACAGTGGRQGPNWGPPAVRAAKSCGRQLRSVDDSGWNHLRRRIPEDHAPLRIRDDESSSSTSGIGADLVLPDIQRNAVPATGRRWPAKADRRRTALRAAPLHPLRQPITPTRQLGRA